MFAGNDEASESRKPEERPPIDGALSCWDPWLISMYIDAVRSVERATRHTPLH